jgi:hypothetical protein
MIYSNVLQLKDINVFLTMKNFFSFYNNGTKLKRIQNFGLLRDKILHVAQNNDTANNDDIEMNDLELDNIQPIDLEHNNLATVENNQTNVSVNETSNSDTNIAVISPIKRYQMDFWELVVAAIHFFSKVKTMILHVKLQQI